MNSIVSSIVMYPGSLLRSGLKSTTKNCKKLIHRVKSKSEPDCDSVRVSTAVATENTVDGRDKPVAIQEC